VTEPMSDERLEQIVRANDTGAGLLWGDARALLAEVVRLRALEHAERERYLTGWKDARDKAVKAIGDRAKDYPLSTQALIDVVREMRP
jgi:hypothetical protein